MKYLITGLGNPGEKYDKTRHNIGFEVLDALAADKKAVFETGRYGDVVTVNHKGRKLILLKPSTYMNLSGKAVRYWLQDQKIPVDRLLIITDDVNLPAGKLRMRTRGSAGGHNGIENIIEIIQNQNFPRLRFGIGSDYPKGGQVQYVLSKWKPEEWEAMQEKINLARDMVFSFVTDGPEKTMSLFNKN